jgi:hypothetical protein
MGCPIRRTGVFGVVCAWLTFGLPTSASAEATELDILDYHLSIRLNLEQHEAFAPLNTLSATARITFLNKNESPVGQIPAILYRLLKVDSVRNGNSEPLQFTQRLDSLEGWDLYQANLITIDLDRPVPSGERATIEIDYAGPIVGMRESGMLYVQDSLDPAFTIIRPESAAYPHLADPTRTSLEYRFGRGNDTFDQVASVTVPDALVVASGLDLSEKRARDGWTTWEYRSNQPASQIILPVAPYEVLETAAARIYFFPEDREGAQRVAKGIARAMALLEDWLGPPGSRASFAVVEIPEWYGSQALRPTVIQDAGAFRDAGAMPELYHEISHFWNVTDPSPAPSRWDEGLAMYLQEITHQELDQGAENLASTWETTFQWLKRQLDEHPEYRGVPLIRAGELNLTSVLSYGGGQLMFALLHYRLGVDQLLALLREFNEAHVASGATSMGFAEFVLRQAPSSKRIIEDWFLGGEYSELVLSRPNFAALVQRYGTDGRQ